MNTKKPMNWEERFNEEIAPMITEYGGICEDPVLEKEIKQFIQQAIEEERKRVLEEVNAMLVRIWKEEASDERLDCIFEIREKVNSLLKSNTKK